MNTAAHRSRVYRTSKFVPAPPARRTSPHELRVVCILSIHLPHAVPSFAKSPLYNVRVILGHKAMSSRTRGTQPVPPVCHRHHTVASFTHRPVRFVRTNFRKWKERSNCGNTGNLWKSYPNL